MGELPFFWEHKCWGNTLHADLKIQRQGSDLKQSCKGGHIVSLSCGSQLLILSYQPHWLTRDLVSQLCTAPFPAQGLPPSGAACLASSACVCAQSLPSCLTLSDPLDCGPPGSSVPEFSRQEYWSGLPCPPAGNLPNPWIEPKSPGSRALQVDSLLMSHQGGPFAVPCFPLLSSTDI